MRIFYDNKGTIVGTINGFSDNPELDKMWIIPGGMKKTDIKMEKIGKDHKLAKTIMEFEDPRNPKQVLDYNFKGKTFVKKVKKQ